jgi:phytanoyl-CoA hydroxylase
MVVMMLTSDAGDAIGRQIEDEFTKKAHEAGFTEEELRSAFNRNMMSTGLLSENPAEFSRQNNRRWLVTEYEAGDVVLHKPHAVRTTSVRS